MKTIQAWQELSRKEVFHKFGRRIDKVAYRMPDGHEADFYIKVEGTSVCVLALTDKEEVVLVRQFRPGPNKIVEELPGGFVDEDEDLATAAARELLEETGYTGSLEQVGYSLHDAYSSMYNYCFVATQCHKVAEPMHTATEQTEAVCIPLDSFRSLIGSGQMTNVGEAYMALDHIGKM